MDYMVVEGSTKEELRIEVKKWLKQGYKLQGGVSIFYRTNNRMSHFAQALINVNWDND